MRNGENLYEILADYNPHRAHPNYYVSAVSKKEAKKKFESFCPWLKVYSVAEVKDREAAEDIWAHPFEHCVFRSL